VLLVLLIPVMPYAMGGAIVDGPVLQVATLTAAATLKALDLICRIRAGPLVDGSLQSERF